MNSPSAAETAGALPKGLTILLLEDNAFDAELTCASLSLDEDGGCRIERVEDREAFECALRTQKIDLILADYSLPAFDGISALGIAQELQPDTPFLFVSGALGEELAIETLKRGATDYVLKHRLERLRPAVLRALRERDERRQRQLAEARLRQLAEENARLYEQARRANLAKDEFIAMISHELRTPMTSILGWTRMLKLGGLSDDEYQTALDAVERSATVQARLIDDLLDLSRISTGKLELRFEPVDVGDVVTTTVDSLRIPAAEKAIALRVDMKNGRCKVRGDRSRLQQVVTNLVQNAIKFTPDGGTVEVSLANTGGDVEVTVRDTGKGIDADALEAIFEPFRQADSMKSAEKGLGLGLSIVRHLVERHGGSVAATSEGPGRGATFRVRLPALAEGERPASEEAIADAMPDFHNRSVLVVEDDAPARNLLAAILQRCGATVQTADSVAGAVSLLHTKRWDAVVSDLGLPVVDGYALMAHIRENFPNGSAPVVVAVTAFGTADDRRRVRNAGFAHHFVKPIDPLSFARSLAALCAR